MIEIRSPHRAGLVFPPLTHVCLVKDEEEEEETDTHTRGSVRNRRQKEKVVVEEAAAEAKENEKKCEREGNEIYGRTQMTVKPASWQRVRREEVVSSVDPSARSFVAALSFTRRVRDDASAPGRVLTDLRSA